MEITKVIGMFFGHNERTIHAAIHKVFESFYAIGG